MKNQRPYLKVWNPELHDREWISRFSWRDLPARDLQLSRVGLRRSSRLEGVSPGPEGRPPTLGARRGRGAAKGLWVQVQGRGRMARHAGETLEEAVLLILCIICGNDFGREFYDAQSSGITTTFTDQKSPVFCYLEP